MSNLPFRGGGAGASCGCGGGPEYSVHPGRRPGPGGGGAAGSPGVTTTCGNVAHSPVYCDDGCCAVEGTPPTHYVPANADMSFALVCEPI
jgi:hypothetical protein